ncbi:ARMC7 family protein [Megaselia abdita]
MKILRRFSSLKILKPGDEFKFKRTINQKEVEDFAILTGDTNPIHLTETPQEKRLIHGSFLNSVVSGVIGTAFPGPGSIVLSQTFQFPNKCVVDEEIQILVKVLEARKIMKLSYECSQLDKIVFQGEAKILRK